MKTLKNTSAGKLIRNISIAVVAAAGFAVLGVAVIRRQFMSPAEKLLIQFRKEAKSHDDIMDLTKSLSLKKYLPFSMKTVQVKSGRLQGFSNEITGFSKAIMICPEYGYVPFIGYVFELEDGQDKAEFIRQLDAYANINWNVWSKADEVIIGVRNNKVFFAMSSSSLESVSDFEKEEAS